MNFCDRVLHFYHQLELPGGLPEGVNVLNPYQEKEVQAVVETFYQKYYSPVRLEEDCHISNTFKKRGELSSEFVYQLINTMGGSSHFYNHFYIGSVSPLGFVVNGKNYNYYDSLELKRTLKPYIIHSLIDQISFGIDTQTCFCMGQGKNYEYLQMLNDELRLFKRIVPLPHPRWVMQYKRKELEYWINETLQLLIKG